jgi:hypothetical protein
MPWNGAGTFNRVYSWLTDQANGVLVRADRMDTDTNDIAAGITNCIARDGQNSPTADIAWGSHKITALANGSAVNDAVNFGQVFTSPAFTTPTAVASPVSTDSSLLLATTAFAKTMDSPAFTGAPTAPTAAAGTSSTQIATTAFAAGLAFSAALPAISGGTANQLVTNNGTVGSWSPYLNVGTIRFKDQTDATKLFALDCSSITTANTRTLTVPDKNGTIGLVADRGLTFLAVINPTAAASADALNVFSASYNNYRVVIDGVAPNVTDSLAMYLAVAGVAQTGLVYFTQGIENAAASVVSSATNRVPLGSIYATGVGGSFIADVMNVNSATSLKIVSSYGMSQQGAGPGYVSYGNTTCYPAASVVSGFRLAWVGVNNFVAQGSVRIYGYN